MHSSVQLDQALTSANRTETAPSRSAGLPERLPWTPAFNEQNDRGRYAAGHFGTQGKRCPENAEGRFECREYCGRDFASLTSRRKHESKFHERPREGEGKLRKGSNKSNDVCKERKEETGREWKEKIAKMLEEAAGILRQDN